MTVLKNMQLFRLIWMVVLTFTFQNISAQTYNPDKVNKKAKAENEKAYGAAMEGRYTDAIRHLDVALKIDPKFVDAILTKAGIHATLKQYKDAVENYKQAFQIDSIYAEEFRLPYSISLAGMGKFEEAQYQVQQFLRIPNLNEQSKRSANYRLRTYEFALHYISAYPESLLLHEPHHLSNNINSTDSEYFPSLTIDGKRMIFTRRLDNRDEDFFVSELVNGVWQKAKPIEGKVNTNLNEGAQNISQDGTVLVFTGCNYPEGAGSCDLYISYLKKDGKWSEPELLPFSTSDWESTPSLSPDKRELYFSSNNPGGYGGKDIWVSRKLSNGKWSKPENLGPTINTPGDESCPFIHADNSTLYFNSNGHDGYGATDLYVVKKEGDGWGRVINLGYPINTIDDEGSLFIAADGKTAYFSSDRINTYGGLDIYSIELNPHVQASPTTWLKGRVYNAVTGEGLPSSIEMIDLSTNTIAFLLQTDEEGNYLVTIPTNKRYAFNVHRKGYLFYSEHYEMKMPIPEDGLAYDIPLQPLTAGASMVLHNIFFDVNASTLTSDSKAELEKIIALMKENPSLEIRIEGHTDNTGTPKDNMELSVRRANAVVEFLVQNGISPKRMTAVGKGETSPIAPNNTEEEKSRNRRTELHIIKADN